VAEQQVAVLRRPLEEREFVAARPRRGDRERGLAVLVVRVGYLDLRLLREAGFTLRRDEVVTIREPEGPARFQWVLAQR